MNILVGEYKANVNAQTVGDDENEWKINPILAHVYEEETSDYSIRWWLQSVSDCYYCC